MRTATGLYAILLAIFLSVGTPLYAYQADETATYTYEVSGSTADWLRTDLKFELGDIFSITAVGIINIWPNCEETKAQEGFPELDCALVQKMGPNGTTAFNPAEEDYPFPGGLVGALVGKVGDSEPFLIGTGGSFIAQDKGRLKLAFNDSRLLGDNSGAFIAEITVPHPDELCAPINDWVNSGVEVEAGQSFAIDASGTINIWSTCTEPNEFGVTCEAMNVSPNGTTAFDPGTQDYPLPNAPVSALIGKINDGNAFLIGEHGAFVAEETGDLYLRTNDVPEYTADDEGCFSVVVSPFEVDEPDVIIVSGTNEDWVSTGITAASGDVFAITARGSVHLASMCEECLSHWATTTGTQATILGNDDYPLPLARAGALIARFGDAPAFYVGSGGEFKATGDGELQFRLNTTGDMSDSAGALIVIVESR